MKPLDARLELEQQVDVDPAPVRPHPPHHVVFPLAQVLAHEAGIDLLEGRAVEPLDPDLGHEPARCRASPRSALSERGITVLHFGAPGHRRRLAARTRSGQSRITPVPAAGRLTRRRAIDASRLAAARLPARTSRHRSSASSAASDESRHLASPTIGPGVAGGRSPHRNASERAAQGFPARCRTVGCPGKQPPWPR